MQPYEIRAELIRQQIKIKDIANELGIAGPSVSQVIAGTRRTPRVRKAIAERLKKPVSALWPEQDIIPLA